MKKFIRIRLVIYFFLLCMLLVSSALGDETIDIYKQALYSISDLDFSAHNIVLRDLAALLSTKSYDMNSDGYIDSSIYEQLGCINTYTIKKPTAIVGYFLDRYQQPIILIAFQGSTLDEYMEDWRYNVNVWRDINGIHQGFDDLYGHLADNLFDYRFCDLPGQPSFIELMEAATDGRGPHFLITGHSLGGAMAQVLTYYMTTRAVSNENIVSYTFASPTPFCRSSITAEETAGIHIHNYINENDVVPEVGINGIQNLYSAGGNIGCNYYMKDDTDDSYAKFVLANYILDKESMLKYILNHESIATTVIKRCIAETMDFYTRAHSMDRYNYLLQNGSQRIEALDFSPISSQGITITESNENYCYEPCYFNRVTNTDALASMKNCYVTTYPQDSDSVLRGLAEYIYGSEVSDVGFNIGQSPDDLFVHLSCSKSGEILNNDFDTAFLLPLEENFSQMGMQYYQAYVTCNGRSYLGRIEKLSLQEKTSKNDEDTNTTDNVKITIHDATDEVIENIPSTNENVSTEEALPAEQGDPNDWVEMHMMGGNVAGYRMGDLWGVVLSDGTIVSEPVYTYLGWHPYSDVLTGVAMRDSQCFVISLDTGVEMKQTAFGAEGGGICWDIGTKQLVQGWNGSYSPAYNDYGLGYYYCIDSTAAVGQEPYMQFALVDIDSHAVNDKTYDRFYLPYDGSYSARIMNDSAKYAIGMRDNACFLVSRTGDEQLLGEDAGYFFDGIAPYKSSGKWGYINSNGEVVVSERYDQATAVGVYNGTTYAWVLENGDWHTISF